MTDQSWRANYHQPGTRLRGLPVRLVRVDIINHSKSRTRRYTFLDADGITYEWFSGNRLDRLFPQIRVGDIDIPMVIDGTIVAVTGYTAFKSYHLERVVVP